MADRDRKKKFKFRETSEKTVTQRSTDTGSWDRWTLSKFPVYKVKDGENEIRILPRTWDDVERWGDSWGLPVKLHYGVGPDNGTYLCNKLRGKSCYLCDERVSLAHDDEEAAKALRPGDRVLCWIVDRKDERAGPQLYAMPKSKVEVDIQLLSKDEKTGEVLQITDPDEGYDVTFTKKGANLNTDYKGVRIARSSSPIHDKERTQDEWLDFIEANPLPDVLNFYDDEYIESIYSGKSSKRKEDDDEEDTKDARRGRSRREDPDDAEDDEADRDRRGRPGSRGEDEEAEERPSRSSRRRGDDPEDEDEPRKAQGSRAGRDGGEDKGRTRRGREEPDDPEPEEEEEEEPKGSDRSRQARESVERLKRRAAEAEEEEEEPKSSRRSRRSRDPGDEIPF